MINLTVEKICQITGGTTNCDGTTTITQAPVFDSREAKPGSFFLALKGENLDGHQFIKAAISNGAIFGLTSKEVPEPHIRVPDVLKALGEIAKFVRSQLPDLKVVAITGSQGKTTTKELLNQMLSQFGETVASEGSYNNELGAPLTLLKCDNSTKYCITELGARHPGDIKYLAEIVQPNIGVVLTIGSAHLGEFGSREIIAKTKGELIDALPNDGVAILGTYDELTPKLNKNFKGKTITFGEKSDCLVRAADVESREGYPYFDLVTPEDRAPVSLRLVGLHQISNALAAAAVGVAFNVPTEKIASALSTAEPKSKWRMELHDLPGLLIINDSYNANPESMTAALRTLALFAQERGGSSWAFLGKMHELGSTSNEAHANIGLLATELGIDHLIGVKESNYGGINADSLEKALEYAREISPGDVVLVKASRAEALNELSDGIIAAWLERGEL
ncbi:MAG: hypothetical protein RL448_102 [Actinomycetota bacterium]|jgi:UDP-N-acetylmuramoyl-tripeptide--D-alanyl-D-alanine ligase